MSAKPKLVKISRMRCSVYIDCDLVGTRPRMENTEIGSCIRKLRYREPEVLRCSLSNGVEISPNAMVGLSYSDSLEHVHFGDQGGNVVVQLPWNPDSIKTLQSRPVNAAVRRQDQNASYRKERKAEANRP